MEALVVPFLLVVGGLLALQAAANVQLSTGMASPFGASTLQLSIGAVLLLALTAVLGTLGAFDLLGEATGWHLLGGLGSAMYITAGILLFPRLGALVTVGLFIAGQMGASLLVDGFGWLGVAREPLDVAAILGAAAVVIGAILIVRAQAGARALGEAARTRPGWITLAVLAGAALPVQGAVNAQLRGDLEAPIATAAFSFVVATAAMALALVAVLALARAPRPRWPAWRGCRGGAGWEGCAARSTSPRCSCRSLRSAPPRRSR